MNKLIYIFLFVCISITATSQITFDKLSHNFGEVFKNNDRVVDIKLVNTSQKNIYLLTVKNDRSVKVLTSNKTVQPDSTLIIRFKYNPTKKGNFKIKTPIYLSNSRDPIIFTMQGNVKEIHNSMGLDCPSFREKNVYEEQEFKLTTLVLDAETLLPIKSAKVKLITNGYLIETLTTYGNGVAKTKIPLGLYYIVTSAQNYYTEEYSEYLNKQNDSIIVYLKKSIVIEEPLLAEEPNIKEHDTTIKDTTVIIERVEEITDTSELSKNIYTPNNIVFLLDVSSSMNHKGKLDLLKASMINLTKVLRDVDKVTIVAYSTFSNVLMKTTTGDKRDEIIEEIKGLRANGMTAGGDGMKMAYKEAYKNLIPNANNQVIMATDGDFNRGATKIDKLVSKYYKKGIKISVIGIKNKEVHVKDMLEISQLGNGNYLYIDNYETSEKILIQEIKRNSLK
jgi:Ca-activated chloride channel family protein